MQLELICDFIKPIKLRKLILNIKIVVSKESK